MMRCVIKVPAYIILNVDAETEEEALEKAKEQILNVL